jgi:1,2-dihydroxy-3-keto-5-methylthiopentene dioxygenase
MSKLRVFTETDPTTPLATVSDHAVIVARLAEVGVRFERWQTEVALQPGASQEAVIRIYKADIDRLMREGAYQSVDVVSLNRDHPDKDALRKKFLEEHTHTEDEVRFFVAGSGLFTLHIGRKIYEVTCAQGDLIGIPKGTRHWFDMGPQPFFVAIRLFINPSGWMAAFTGDDIASGFPRYEPGQGA